MGIWYEFAVVHGRVLVWWTDAAGRPRQAWLSAEAGEKIIVAQGRFDLSMQKALDDAVESQD